MNCDHKYAYSRSESYWRFEGRNSREYYHCDYYYCEKCLNEVTVEKKHLCYDSELWKLPEWAKLIKNKIS